MHKKPLFPVLFAAAALAAPPAMAGSSSASFGVSLVIEPACRTAALEETGKLVPDPRSALRIARAALAERNGGTAPTPSELRIAHYPADTGKWEIVQTGETEGRETVLLIDKCTADISERR